MSQANKTQSTQQTVIMDDESASSSFRVLMQRSVHSSVNSHEIGNQLLIADWKKRQYDKNGFTLPATAQTLYLYAENRKSHSRSLFTNMKKADSNLKNEKTKHAHHIVAAKDHRAEPSRQIMFSKGIGINDHCNGVYLNRVGHNRMHTDLYYAIISLKIDRVKDDDSSTLRELLVGIGNRLKTGVDIY